MSQSKLHPEYLRQKALQDAYLARKNKKTDFYNGIYDRWENPVLTRESIPLSWRFDLNPETNPHFMERLGVNAVFNSGAIKLNGKYYLVARIEGNDRKSFFGVAESDSPVEGFHFWEKPILLPDTCPEETNVYDMRLTQHEDGWIYGVFCSESKDNSVNDLSAAVAAAGIVRTKDLKTWERLPNLVTKRSPQQPALTERYEMFICGCEMGNAFSELNDPIDQEMRFKEQMRLSEKGDDEAMIIDHDFLRALQYGMPPTSGIGIGIDRLTMLMTGQETIQEVILFPQMKPEKKMPQDSIEAWAKIGVSEEWVYVLRKAGFNLLSDICGEKAQGLQQKLGEINKKYKLGYEKPSVDEIQRWIDAVTPAETEA